MSGYKEWDSKPALVKQYGLDWPDSREPSGALRPEISFVVSEGHLDGTFFGEDLSILSLVRAIRRDCGWNIPLYVGEPGKEKASISKIIHGAGIMWQGNMSRNYPLSVSDAVGIYNFNEGAFSKCSVPKGTLPNLIDGDIYGRDYRAPWLVDKMQKLEGTYRGNRPPLLEIFGLDPSKPTVVHHGRMSSSKADPKGYGIGKVFGRLPVERYNFLFFGSAPDKKIVDSLRKRGASVVTALDITQLDDGKYEKHRARCVEDLSERGIRIHPEGSMKELPSRYSSNEDLVLWPYPIGALSKESRVAAIHLRQGANPLDSSITQMGLSMPVATISWVFEHEQGKHTRYVSDGTTEQLPEGRLESLVYLADPNNETGTPIALKCSRGLPDRAADRLAAELQSYLEMPQGEYESVVEAQREHIEGRFGPKATERRLRNIGEVYGGKTEGAFARLVGNLKKKF